jgi:hypothetical protein
VLAGTIGLVVVGLILLAVALAKRKSTGLAERTVDPRISAPVDVK